MAFKSFGIKAGNESRKPFLEEYLDTLPKKERKAMNNTQHDVVLLSLSQKGLILSTELFSVFVWKGSDIFTYLVEAMESYREGTPHKSLVVFIDDEVTASYDLGVDEEETATWDTYKGGKKLKRCTDVEDTPLVRSNPFL